MAGEPGVRSRRWPGYEASDKELIKLVLKKLERVSEEKRGAQLRAVISLAFPGQKKIYTFEGILRGKISQKPTKRRIRGYPFRSIFMPADSKRYLSQKRIIAHRKKAIEKALPILKKFLLKH